MQKLKRLPLLKQLENMLSNLLPSVLTLPSLLSELPRFLKKAALIVLCLLLLWMLFGCTATRTVRPPLPPQADARQINDFHGRTHRDVMRYAIEMREGFMSCEADKASIRSLYKNENK